MVKNLPATQETQVQSLGQEYSLGKEMATPSSILAWEIPWTESLAGYSPCGHKELDTAEKKEFFPITNHCAFYLKAGTHEFPDRFMLHILLHC